MNTKCAKCNSVFEDVDDKEYSIFCTGGHCCCNKCLRIAVRNATAKRSSVVHCSVEGCSGRFQDKDVEGKIPQKLHDDFHKSKNETSQLPLRIVNNRGLQTQIIEQIIKEDGKYCVGFGGDVEKWGSYMRKKIRLVSIIGQQSTGKSTLLNGLFGTEFATLDAVKDGLQKQTRGLWVGVDRNIPADAEEQIVVLDVEGVDGKESVLNPNAKTFENQSSLFSLCMSSVVIINMMENTLGLEPGARLPMLEAVFREAGLIHKQSNGARTLLLFVIRDCNMGVPLSILQGSVEEILQQAWSADADVSPMELFDVQVYPLPSLLLPASAGAGAGTGAGAGSPSSPSEWAAAAAAHVQEKTAELRAAFHDSHNPLYMFQGRAGKAYGGVGELAQLAPRVWEVIEGSKEVVMEPLRTMTAEYMCVQTLGNVIERWQPQIATLMNGLERLQSESTAEQAAALIAQSSNITRSAIAMYRQEAPTHVEEAHVRVLNCITRDLTDHNDMVVRLCSMSADKAELDKLAEKHKLSCEHLQHELERVKGELVRLEESWEQRKQTNERLEAEVQVEKGRVKAAEQELAALRRLKGKEKQQSAEKQKALEDTCAEQRRRTVEMERALAVAREEERVAEEERHRRQLEVQQAEVERIAAQQMLATAQAVQAQRIAEEHRRQMEEELRRRQAAMRWNRD